MVKREISNTSDANKVENIGIEYSKQSIDEADAVIYVTDLSSIITKEDEEIYELIKDKKQEDYYYVSIVHDGGVVKNDYIKITFSTEN